MFVEKVMMIVRTKQIYQNRKRGNAIPNKVFDVPQNCQKYLPKYPIAR